MDAVVVLGLIFTVVLLSRLGTSRSRHQAESQSTIEPWQIRQWRQDRADREEYELARQNGKTAEPFEEWRLAREAEKQRASFEARLREATELGAVHRAVKRRCLTRGSFDPFAPSERNGLGILPEEADLYRRLSDLNGEVSRSSMSPGPILILKPHLKRDDEQRDRLNLEQLDREWSKLLATVEHDYWASAVEELDEKHPTEPYWLEFKQPSETEIYPYSSGCWRAISKEWANHMGNPIIGFAPSMNGAIVDLFRNIDSARGKVRIRRR